MNPRDRQFTPVPDSAIDRLVDGDLNESDRREILLALEEDPDGWRRCALAFLEDQSWREALAYPASVGPKVASIPPSPPSIRPPTRWIRRASMVASLLALSFAAGRFSPGNPRVEVSRADSPKPVETIPEPIREVGYIDFVDGSSGETPPRRLPILSGPGLDEKMFRDRPPTVPDYVRARLERQGYQVKERRKLVSITLEDGRRVSIPMDEVELDYVGQKPL